MKMTVFLIGCFSLFLAAALPAHPPKGNWNLEDGIAGVLDPENDGGEIGDEATGRDDSPLSEPWDEYYWRFDGLIRTSNIRGLFVDNGDGTASQNIEVFRTGGTFKLHADHLWGQPAGTLYEISIHSHFIGVNYFESISDEWVWKETTGSSYVRGVFKDDPYLFELTDNIHFDYYGYNSIVGHNLYSGRMTSVIISISLLGDLNYDGDVDGSDLAAYIIDPGDITLESVAENFGDGNL